VFNLHLKLSEYELVALHDYLASNGARNDLRTSYGHRGAHELLSSMLTQMEPAMKLRREKYRQRNLRRQKC